MSPLLLGALVLLAVAPAYALLLRFSRRYSLNRFTLFIGMLAVCALPYSYLPGPTPELSAAIQTSVGALEQASYVDWGARTQVQAPVAEVKREASTVASAPVTPIAEPVRYSGWRMFYGLGAGLMGLGLLFRLGFLIRLHLRSRPTPDGYRVLADGPAGQAFTFGRTVYVSAEQPGGPDFAHVLAHERVHARQWHSVDLLMSELFTCVFWFHPVAWWLRKQLRANLEYLVDQTVVTEGRNRRAYQLALVRQSQGIPARVQLSLPFSEVSLQQRVRRMAGVPQYQFLAILATVALFGWFTLSALLFCGTEGPGDDTHEYLAASAWPGDPYFAYYQRTLPEIESVEVYTNRMLSGDEYLRVRAILGQVPGAKLYVSKAEWQEEPSFQLSYGNAESGRFHAVPVRPQQDIYLIGLSKQQENQSLNAYLPFAKRKTENVWEPESGERRIVVNYTGNDFTESLDLVDFQTEDLLNGPLVFINGEPIELRAAPRDKKNTVRINGEDVSRMSAAEWTHIRVEATPTRTAGRTLDLYFRRLPTAEEIKRAQTYIEQYSQDQLRVFRSCDDDAQELTLSLNKAGEMMGVHRGLKVGQDLTAPLHYSLTNYGRSGSYGSFTSGANWPEGAPTGAIVIRHHNNWIDLTVAGSPDYPAAELDELSPTELLRCTLLSFLPAGTEMKGAWGYVYRDASPGLLDQLKGIVSDHEYGERPLRLYVNGRPVSEAEFRSYRAEHEAAYAMMSTVQFEERVPVLIWLVDEGE